MYVPGFFVSTLSASNRKEKKGMDLTMNTFFKNIMENTVFVLEFFAIAAALVVVAVIAEKFIQKKNGEKTKLLTTKKVAMIGMFSAIAGVLMAVAEFPIIILAPDFYKIDPSELPVLICGFAFGPVAGVLTELVKIIIKLIFRPTSTAFVGEFANFCVGCSFILPATIIYHMKKKKSVAIIGCVAGTVVMTVFGTLFNAVYLLPAFSVLYHAPVDAFIAAGNAINVGVHDIYSFVAICVAPLNLVKGTGVSILTFLVYKPLSPILKASYDNSVKKQTVNN